MRTPRLLIGLACWAYALGAAGADLVVRLDPERLGTAKVAYRDAGRLAAFPAPTIHWRRPGLASAAELQDVVETIAYPVVRASAQPITALVVEFLPNDATAIGVIVLWSNGDAREARIERGANGRFGARAYEVFFHKPTP